MRAGPPLNSVLTPYDYGVVFAEGVAAYAKHGKDAVSPYLSLDGYATLADHARALAWENGWWLAYKRGPLDE